MMGRKRDPFGSILRPDTLSPISMKRPRQPMLFTPGQAFMMAILCSCLTAVVTHLFSYYPGIPSSYSSLLVPSSHAKTSELRRASVDYQTSTYARVQVPQEEKEQKEKEDSGDLEGENTEEEDDDSVDDVVSSDDEEDSNEPSGEEVESNEAESKSGALLLFSALDPYIGRKSFNDDVKQKKPITETNEKAWPDPDITALDPGLVVTRNGISHPSIVWLMSFPNSGTSFTIHMTREASNCTTATNYAMEGDIRNLPSVQVIQGEAGRNGPFLELIRDKFTNIPPMILTKTHCTGYCSHCGPWKLLFHTPRSFMRGCLTGTRAVQTENGLESFDVIYEASLVKKAIHLFRHPLDNVVARFHLEFNEMSAAGKTEYVAMFPKNATGFRKWCKRSDTNMKLFESKYIDDDLKRAMFEVPCFNEFHKYVQWHNMAFYASHDMSIETMLLHYHEYSDDFEKTRDKVLNFLGLPNTGPPMEFHSGKIYRHYYTREQKIAIKKFIKEYSNPDTWEQLKDYDFEIEAPEQTATQSNIELKGFVIA